MKLRIFSDLHLEFHADGGEKFVREDLNLNNADALLLAGDISDAKGINRALDLISKAFSGPIIYVAGNHEYYGGSRESTGAIVAAQMVNPNLVWLENKIRIESEIHFAGTTLWFGNHPGAPEWALNDFRRIKNLRDWVHDANRHAVDFLDRAPMNGGVVITHHLPSYDCVHPKYANSMLNPFFVGAELRDLIVSKKPKLWVHGHSHESTRERIGDTLVVSNPYGYHGYEVNPSFNLSFTVVV